MSVLTHTEPKYSRPHAPHARTLYFQFAYGGSRKAFSGNPCVSRTLPEAREARNPTPPPVPRPVRLSPVPVSLLRRTRQLRKARLNAH